MSNLVPSSWKESFDGLRGRVMRLFDRWQPHRTPIERDDNAYWPASLLEFGGPAVDVVENDDDLLVSADLPGLSEKDFNVELEGDRLILRGEKQASREDKGRGYYYAERSYGSFYRAIPLPCEVDGDKADAKYKHGVLRLRLPKTPAAKARRKRVTIN